VAPINGATALNWPRFFEDFDLGKQQPVFS